MSTDAVSFRAFLHESRLEMFETSIAARGMRYQYDDHRARFELPSGLFVVIEKTDSCRIVAGGFVDIDPANLIRFADVLITEYRRSRSTPPAAYIPCPGLPRDATAAGAAASSMPAYETAQDGGSLAAWRAVCEGLPATGGRGIKNPGFLCYFNAAIAALSACPQYGEQVRALAVGKPENSVVVQLADVFNDLSDLTRQPLGYYGTSVERLTRSLERAGCPLPVTDHRKMQDSGELLQFLLAAAETQFLTFDIQKDGDVEEVSLLMPQLPERTADGDDRISLQDCIGPFALAFEAPRLLPIWLSRSVPTEGGEMRKVDRACFFPLKMDIAVRDVDVVTMVPYYLRAVVLHNGCSVSSGHYLTVVPTPDGMTSDSPYPLMWEIRNDSRPSVQRLGTLFEEILHNGICYLYEKAPPDLT